ncbi:MAG: aspartate/glutamate racemase family protein [Cyanobacteria bacterium P01_C01_bin.118]
MKTIGLLGGMSWESTITYYRAINEGIKTKLGGLHSAKIALYSVDFDPIEKLQHAGNWAEMGQVLTKAASGVQAAGADFLLIGTNTMHKVAPQIEAAIDIPLLHIGDAIADTLHQQGIQTVGLLGTAFTMEQDFYRSRLRERHGLEVLIPNYQDRKIVHQIIYQELCLGKLEPQSKADYIKIINTLSARGAEAIILGCTEIGLLVQQNDTDVPLFDSTIIHAAKAVDYALT